LSHKAADALHTALMLDPFNKKIHEKYRRVKEQELNLEIEANLAKLAEDPWKVALHLDLGKLYYTLGDTEKAVMELQLALKDQVRAPFAYNLLGNCFRREGRFDLARKNFEKALQIIPPELLEPRRMLLFNLGSTYEAQGALLKAVALYEEVLAEDASFGELKKHLKKLKANKISSLRSKKLVSVIRKIGKGEIFALWGPDGQSIEKSTKDAAAVISFGQTHNIEGFELCMQGMYQSARDEFALAVALDNKFAPALNNLAVMQMLEGNLTEAQCNLAVALDEDFASAVFYNNLAVLFYLKGNLAEARPLLEKAKTLDGSSSAVTLNLGVVLYLQGEVAAALDLFKSITTDDVLTELARDNLKYRIP
jgi:Flp pilus assembly protein TadD